MKESGQPSAISFQQNLDKRLMVFEILIGQAISRACLLFVGCILCTILSVRRAHPTREVGNYCPVNL